MKKLRIIGGIYRGRKLAEFKGKNIRPTSDMVRESLFNILRNRIEGAVFLDLFSGSGAVGIEALSRGAGKVFFNDIDKNSVALLQRNLTKLNVQEKCDVSLMDALRYIENTKDKFDIIFLDPPYKTDLNERILCAIKEKLNTGGIVVYESEKSFDIEIENFLKYDTRKYGRAFLNFFKV